MPFLVMETKFQVILGLQWLAQTQPVVDWARKSLVVSGGGSEREKKHVPRGNLSSVEMNVMLGALNSEQDEMFLLSVSEVRGRQAQDPAVEALLKEFSGVFPDALPLELPPDRGSSFKIVLKPGTVSKVRPMKRFSQKDLESLQQEVESLLKAGLIKPSESEFGAQVLFVNKKDGTRRMCIDYL